MDAESLEIQLQMGPLEVNLFASLLTKLQLEAGSRSARDRYIQPGLVMKGGICQPSMVLDIMLPQPGEGTSSQALIITPLWTVQLWYLLLLEMLEDFPQTNFQPSCYRTTCHWVMFPDP